MYLSRFLLLGAAICAALLPSCSKKEADSGKPKVAIVTNNADPFWSIAEKGAKDAAEKQGVELIFRMPERGEAGLQRDIVNECIRLGASGIAVSVINPDEQTVDLKNVSKQVNLLTMDSDASESGRLTYVGTDNYEAGKAVGRLVKEALPNGGTIAIFVGQITPVNAQQRYQGVVDELAGEKNAKGPKFGKYTLYKGEAITDNKSDVVAQDNAKDAIAKLEGTENLCFIGLWAYNPPAILEAVRSKGKVGKIKIVGFDENPLTLQGIEQGSIYATVVQDPYNFGYKSVEILADLAKGGDKSKVGSGTVSYRIVVKESGKDPVTGAERLGVKKFETDLNKLLGK
jgi:ribose transport system substrate-binding protein